MKSFTSGLPTDLFNAVSIARQARSRGQTAAFAGGGSDLLGMMKERLVTPDVLVYLKPVKGLDSVVTGARGSAPVTIGGLTTLDALSRHDLIRSRYTVLAEAAETVATPQIRNVATVAGNICQRPWCWYFRNGFKCFKNGGSVCYSVNGENEFHAIFGGGPSYIVHPSDTATALVALDARFRLNGPSGQRVVSAGDFFTLPKDSPARENVLGEDEILSAITLPSASASTRSAYHKVMDREAWTHAVVSAAVVLDLQGGECRAARVVLGGVAPIPWRVPEVEKMLVGKRITPELATAAGEAAVAGARPLAKNRYKVAMTRSLVARALKETAERSA